MNPIYSELDYAMVVIAWVIVMAALGGFMMGYIMADNRRKADDAFNPKFRPDESGKAW